MKFTENLLQIENNNYKPLRNIYLKLKKKNLIGPISSFMEENILRLSNNEFTEETFLKYSDSLNSKISHFINRLIINEDFKSITKELTKEANEIVLSAFIKYRG